jgi:hemerythrin
MLTGFRGEWSFAILRALEAGIEPMSTGWTEEMALNHPVIDGHHQELFRRYDALAQASARGDRCEAARLFEYLGFYVVEHFGAEERLMEETGYPERAEHRAAHDQFLQDYLAHGQAFVDSEPSASPPAQVVEWMADWLRLHIAGTDVRLAAFLARRASPG